LTSIRNRTTPDQSKEERTMKCLNKNVLIALAAVALVVLILKPSWTLTALPLLLLAACPLSMMFMMRHMSGQSGGGDAAGGPAQPETDRNPEIRAPQAELRALKADQAHRCARRDNRRLLVHTPSTIYVQRS
jgi:hypothetical protein